MTQKKREAGLPVSLKRIFCLRLLKDILAQAAGGAHPVVGDLVPRGAGGDAVVGVTHGGVVLIAAGADILVHLPFPLNQPK